MKAAVTLTLEPPRSLSQHDCAGHCNTDLGLPEESVKVRATHDAMIVNKVRNDAGLWLLQEHCAMDICILVNNGQIFFLALCEKQEMKQ